MRRNQMERYGANVQHWLPSIFPNESCMSLSNRRHLGHKFGVFAPGMSVSRPELVPSVVRAVSRPPMTSLLETATGRHG